MSFRGSGFQRGSFRGRGMVRPAGSVTFSSGRSGWRSRGSATFSGRRGVSGTPSRSPTPLCTQCGRYHAGECWGPNPFPVVCFRCNQPGHYANSCSEDKGTWSSYPSVSQSSVGIIHCKVVWREAEVEVVEVLVWEHQ